MYNSTIEPKYAERINCLTPKELDMNEHPNLTSSFLVIPTTKPIWGLESRTTR
jgi:hypothetical protein